MTFNPIRTRNAIGGLVPEKDGAELTFGTVTAINADGSVQVLVGAQSTRCTPHGRLAEGDRVQVAYSGGVCFAWLIGDDGEIPAGGTSGQVLAKASAADYDITWITPTGGGGVSHTYALSGSGAVVSLTADGGQTGNAGTATVTLSDATTSAKGVVQLLTATDSTSEAKAATPKAVKDALAAAKSYTDAQIVAAGAVTGVKGAAQEDYQTGNVSLSASDVGAAPVSHTHAASSITTTNSNVQADIDAIESDLDDLDDALAGKANSTHYHSASAITSGTLGVARGGTGASTLGKGIVYHSASGTGALSIATAANIVSEIGNTPVNRAAADANGDAIATAAALSSVSDAKAEKTEAIKNITRSGTTFTATRCDDTTFTFDQRDTTYSNMTQAQLDAGTQTGGYLISPKLIADYVAAHSGGGQSYDTLYYSLAGSHDNITLSASAANYDHMRIYFEKDSDTEARGSIDVYKPDGKSISTVLVNVYSGGVQFLGRVWNISGTSITGNGSEAWANCSTGISGGLDSSPSIQIYRVEAWN